MKQDVEIKREEGKLGNKRKEEERELKYLEVERKTIMNKEME